MENDSWFNRTYSKLSDRLSEQQWFQQLKGKWDELDPKSKMYLQYAGIAGALLLGGGLVVSNIWSVSSLKREMNDKMELVSLIQSSNDEIRRLRDSNQGAFGGGDDQSWSAYFQGLAGSAGIDKTVLTLGKESALKAGESAVESLVELDLKHVNIKQVVRFAFQIENGTKPAKLRALTIDTGSDPAGYLNATLTVSAYKPLPTPK